MAEIKGFANEVLNECLKSLGMEFVYFAYPLGVMNYSVCEEIEKVAVVGGQGQINPLYAVTVTANGGIKGVKGVILHTLLHCLFLHPFKAVQGGKIYDLACDITVGFILDDLGYPCGEKSLIAKRKAVYKSIIDGFGNVNDKTATEFCQNLSEQELDIYRSYFTVCDHSSWQNGDKGQDDGEQTISIPTQSEDDGDSSDLEKTWQAIASNLIPQIGKLNPTLRRMIALSVGESGNYKSFLKDFLRRRERIKPSDEEFDYIYYCLGLRNYGNVPLIENLEYSDKRDYSDIAIAVDTSGSTDGEPIKILLKEVFSLIKSMETGGEKYRVRIIQCDLKIQREDIVESSEEFAQMLKGYELQGGGGTDFTPVFDYLTSLKRNGEKIEGLIYFTDGVGVYPREIPPFKTCFAIIGEDEQIQVPHFAYKINVDK